MELYNFSEHVGIYHIDPSICDEVVPVLLDMRDNEPSEGRSNVKGWQKNYLQFMPEFNDLKSAIMEQFDFYVSKLHEMYYDMESGGTPRWSISMDNLFANVNGPGSYHVLHNHAGCNYSGVIYLQTPDSGEALVVISISGLPFYSPWMGAMQSETHQDYYVVLRQKKV